MFFLPSLRNSSGQTPADVAQAHGFDDCFDLMVSRSQLHGPSPHQDQHQHHSRKRLLAAMDTERLKKARRVESKGTFRRSHWSNLREICTWDSCTFSLRL